MCFRLTPIGACMALAFGSGAQAQSHAEAAQSVHKVTVTGSTIDDRFGEDARAPASTTVITGRQIEEQHAENLADVLKAIPGVTLDTQGGDDLKIKLRGVENQRYMGEKPGVAIVIDGVPVFERTGKVNIDMDNIDSIKVIKGGASFLFGEDALSGAVIITTKRGAANKGFAVEADRGSSGYERNLVRVGGAGSRWSAHVQASQRKADGWHFQSNYKAEAVSGNLQWMPTDTSTLTFGAEVEERFRDKHGTVRGATQALRDPRGEDGRDYARHFDVDLQRFNLTYSNDLSENSNLLATLYQYKDHTIFWSGPQSYAASGAKVTDVDAYTTINDYRQIQRGFKTEYRNAIGPWAFMLGAEIKRNRYDNLTSAKTSYRSGPTAAPVMQGTVRSDDVTRENVEALYGEIKWSPSDNWELTGNARHDRIHFAYSENPIAIKPVPDMYSERRFHASSFRLGAAWNGWENTTLFANISTGFRVPTTEQMYRGSNKMDGRVESNPHLKPERAVNYELGLRTSFQLMQRDASLQATVFQIDRKDFILDTNGQYGGARGMASRYENVGGMRSRGLELALKSSFTPNWDWDVSYTWLDSYFTRYDRFVQTLGNPNGALAGTPPRCAGPVINWDNCYRPAVHNNAGKKIPRTPPHALNLRTAWRFAQGWKLSGEMDWRAASWADEINQEKWPGRTLFNLGLDYTRKLPTWGKGAQLSAFIKVENLFNRSHWRHARGINDSQSYATGNRYDGIYNVEDLSLTVHPGRIWRAGLAIRF